MLLGGAIGGCAEAPGPTTDGLKTLSLKISEDSYAQLLLGGKEKDFVAATLSLGDARLPGLLSLAGESSIEHPKKSFRFESSVDTPLGYRSLKFSAQVRDSSFVRTLLGQRIYAAAGVLTPEVEPVVLFVNRERLGLFLLVERVNQKFYERRGFSVDRLYKSKLLRSSFTEIMIHDPRAGVESEEGPFYDQEIRRLALWANSPASAEAMAKFERAADAENLIRYFAATTFLLNCDGLDNNLRIFHEKTDERLFVSPWDWDMAYVTSCGFADMLRKNRLLSKILEYPDLRARFKQALNALLAEFPPERLDTIIDADIERIEAAYRRDRYLGGTGRNPLNEKIELKRLHHAWSSDGLGPVLGAP